jgi:hypothetical protein
MHAYTPGPKPQSAEQRGRQAGQVLSSPQDQAQVDGAAVIGHQQLGGGNHVFH